MESTIKGSRTSQEKNGTGISIPSRPRSRYYMQKMELLKQVQQKQSAPVGETSHDGNLVSNLLKKKEKYANLAVEEFVSISSTEIETKVNFVDQIRAAIPEELESTTNGAQPSKDSVDNSLIKNLDQLNISSMNDSIHNVLEKQESAASTLELSVIETDKLKWMESVERADCGTKPVDGKSGLFEARFDTSGTILYPDSEIPFTAGLHHHGHDPEKPGYTLDEILILLQSSLQPQKLWAINIFTAIIRQAKLSLYDDYLEDSLLKKMVDENLVLPLRYLLDDAALPVISAALIALQNFLANEVDEALTDLMLSWNDHPLIFELKPEIELESGSTGEDELNDAQLMKVDVIKGLLRTHLLTRLNFILVIFSESLDTGALSAMFVILTRIARHSQAVARQVAESETLMQHIMSPKLTERLPVQQMSFLRVLCHVLGPVSYSWSKKFFDDTAAWISALRTEINSFVVRDMITESLNLLIILAHHNEVPTSSMSILDVFPQLLFSAGPKSTYKTTKWDADVCSRVLMLFSLWWPMYSSAPFKNCISKIVPIVVDSFIEIQRSGDARAHMIQLKASYLRFLGRYISLEKSPPSYLLTGIFDHIENILMGDHILMLIRISNADVSKVDPDALPSYNLVLRGGNAVHPVFIGAAGYDFFFCVFRYLNAAGKNWKLTTSLACRIDGILALISEYSPSEKDFWNSRYTTLFLEVLLFGYRCSLAKQDVKKTKVFTAALNLAALLSQHQHSELKLILTEILFSLSYVRGGVIRTHLDEETITYMEVVHEVFLDLGPLGFLNSKSLITESRDPTVFNRLWIFECFAYIVSWAKTNHSPRLMEFVRGYFSWLLLFIQNTVTIKFSELYTSLAEFFDDDGFYRDHYVSQRLCETLTYLTSKPVSEIEISSQKKFKQKQLTDFYVDVVDNYAATSYGDRVFTIFLLVPVFQKCDPVFRVCFWGPEKQLPSMIRIHHLDLYYPVIRHLEPAEENIVLLRQYFTCLVTRSITEAKNPLMFLIAVNHLNAMLKRTLNDEESKLKNKLLTFLSANQKALLAQQLMRYKGPSTTKETTLILLDTVPNDILNVLGFHN